MASVVGLHTSPVHGFSKSAVDRVELVAGVGVAGDVHAGPVVRHRSRVTSDAPLPNLRQVHLIAAEVLAELAAGGDPIDPGALGENITTDGLDLHALGTGSVLALGDDALVAVTGLRNPCRQIEGFRPGLLAEVRRRGPRGEVVHRAGIMGVVVRGGPVEVGDRIEVSVPPGPLRPLERV